MQFQSNLNIDERVILETSSEFRFNLVFAGFEFDGFCVENNQELNQF